MKKSVLALVLFLSTIGFVYAERAGTPVKMSVVSTASVPLQTLYTHSNTTVFSTLQGVSNVAVYNATAGAMAFSVRGNSCGSSTQDAYVVPATSGLVVENVSVGKAICVRSLTGSSISSASYYVSAW